MRLPTAFRSVPPDSDRWPDEPDEPDPEARWGNPEEDLVSVPSVETRAPESGSEGGGVEIDAEVARLFWAAVVYANVAVAGVTIGPLLVAFRGQLTVGGVAIVVGLLALYRTYDLYRTHQARVVNGDGDGDEADDGDGADVADERTDRDADATPRRDAG